MEGQGCILLELQVNYSSQIEWGNDYFEYSYGP